MNSKICFVKCFALSVETHSLSSGQTTAFFLYFQFSIAVTVKISIPGIKNLVYCVVGVGDLIRICFLKGQKEFIKSKGRKQHSIVMLQAVASTNKSFICTPPSSNVTRPLWFFFSCRLFHSSSLRLSFLYGSFHLLSIDRVISAPSAHSLLFTFA